MTVFRENVPWRQLLPGLAALGALVAGALFVLTQMRVGQLTGTMFTLYALADEARGVLKGSDVWLAGQRVGVIKEVSFRASESTAHDEILLKLHILEKHSSLVRRDSRAEVIRGARLIGNPVLQLGVGSSGSPSLAEGDTLRISPQFDTELLVSRVDEMSLQVPSLLSDLQTLGRSATQLDTVFRSFLSVSDTSSIAALLGVFSDELGATAEAFSRGTLGMFSRDTRLRSTIGSVRSGSQALVTRYSTIAAPGSGIADPALLAALQRVVQQFAEFSSAASLRADDYATGAKARALSLEIDRLTAALRSLSADARAHPLRYMIF
jgi:hypothetical protein